MKEAKSRAETKKEKDIFIADFRVSSGKYQNF